MRCLVLVLALAGCGGSKTAQNDFSITGDIALPVVSKCIGIVACASGCTSADCVSSCEGPADATSIAHYEALVACANAACASGDAGGDAGQSCDPSDTTCLKCVDDATHDKSTVCATEYMTCLD